MAGVPIAEHSRYTWRPSTTLSSYLPPDFCIQLDCLTEQGGYRRFMPTESTNAFLLKASLGGLAILIEKKDLDPEIRFTYDVMRLVFQHSARLREHFGRKRPVNHVFSGF